MKAKNHLFKSIFGVLLTASVLMTSCGQSGGSSQSTNSETPSSGTSSSTSSSQSATTERKKLTIAIAQSPNIQNMDTNYLTNLIEEKMNVDLEFMMLPASSADAKTKFAMMVTSNSELPDVLTGGYGDATMSDYASKGIFVPLDEYYADPETAPNFQSLEPEVQDFLLSSLKLADGKVYSLFSYGTSIWNEFYYRAFINQEWLDKLNLSVPTTTDEFTEVLRAFATQDPNGNGKADEIPLIGAKDGGYGQEVVPSVMSAFTYVNPDHNYLYVEDGKIKASYTLPEFRDGLEYMNMLVNEGLLSPLSFTQDYQQLKAIASSEEAIAGVVTCGSTSNFGANDSPTCKRMSLLAPLTGPKGECNAVDTPINPVKLWFVTKDCEDPAFAFKVDDCFLEREVSVTARYGERGVDWTDDPAVTALYHGDYESLGYEVEYAVDMDGNLWANPQNKHWYGNPPKYENYFNYRFSTVLKEDYEKQKAEGTLPPQYAVDHMATYGQHTREENIVQLQYTTEELEQISVEKTAIDEYVRTNIVSFITGTRPLSQWDDFQKELQDMGLEKYLSIAQQAYDRS